MRPQPPPPKLAHRFIAMFCFLTCGVITFVTFASLLNGPQSLFDVMLQLCVATMMALYSAIYSAPEANPLEEDRMPVTKRSHLETEKMRGNRF